MHRFTPARILFVALAGLIALVGNLLVEHAALGAPAPAIRVARDAPASLARGANRGQVPGEAAAAIPGAGLARICGTRIESALDLLEGRLERSMAAPEPTTFSIDTAGIAVMEDDGTFFYSGQGQHAVLDVAALAQAFYRSHGDDYDALAIYLSSGLSTWLGSATALAAAYVVKNDVQGVGLGLFDLGAGLGTPPGLHTLLSMNGLDRYPGDPDSVFSDPGDTFNAMDVLAHEFAHRWCAYVYVDSAGQAVPALLGRDYQHWNFFADVDSSVMEGCDWISPAPDSFLTDGVSDGYGRLDQYLMGLRGAGEIDSFFVVNDPTSMNPPGTYVPSSIPSIGVGCRGRATWWHIPDVEAANGARLPAAAASPHLFHVAIVLVTPHGVAPTAADLTKLGRFRSRFVSYFDAGTGGRGAIDLELKSRAGRVRIVHQPLRDTEDALSPRPIGARITIEQAGIRLAVDPASVRAWARSGGAGPFNPIALAPVAPDSFAGSLPPAPSGTVSEYYLYAASDSAGIDATDPPAGAAAPYACFTGPDTLPPAIAHVPIPDYAFDRLPVTLLARITDNAALDSAWIEFSVNGGAASSAPLSIAGRDSFSAGLGAGLQSGDRLAYRFVARDRAASPNLAYSKPAFDTLRVGPDWLEDLENGFPAGWQHYLLRRRDPWQLSHQRAFAPGGTSWKAGGCDTLPYPPHLDGVVMTPFVYGIAPGTVFTFEHWWDLEDDAGEAFDGAIVEAQQGYDGAWQQVIFSDYDHQSHDRALTNAPVGVPAHVPCWSGRSNGWRTEAVNLDSYAPDPVRFRFHMAADDFVGREGWYVDHIRVLYPGGATADLTPTTPRLRIGLPAPNPARARLLQSLELARAAEVSWELFDLAGRRVATLWRGRRSAGPGMLSAALPGTLSSGLYFVRVALDGSARSTSRLAVVR